jgi:hypothetical protein
VARARRPRACGARCDAWGPGDGVQWARAGEPSSPPSAYRDPTRRRTRRRVEWPTGPSLPGFGRACSPRAGGARAPWPAPSGQPGSEDAVRPALTDRATAQSLPTSNRAAGAFPALSPTASHETPQPRQPVLLPLRAAASQAGRNVVAHAPAAPGIRVARSLPRQNPSHGREVVTEWLPGMARRRRRRAEEGAGNRCPWRQPRYGSAGGRAVRHGRTPHGLGRLAHHLAGPAPRLAPVPRHRGARRGASRSRHCIRASSICTGRLRTWVSGSASSASSLAAGSCPGCGSRCPTTARCVSCSSIALTSTGSSRLGRSGARSVKRDNPRGLRASVRRGSVRHRYRVSARACPSRGTGRSRVPIPMHTGPVRGRRRGREGQMALRARFAVGSGGVAGVEAQACQGVPPRDRVLGDRVGRQVLEGHQSL